jgi:branched-chain amino acid transport system permease protein
MLTNRFKITKAIWNTHFLGTVFVVGILLALPVFIKDPYIWGLLVMANIYASFGSSFDLLLGFTGLAVLGFEVFVGLGAYAAAFLNLYVGIPPWATMILGGLVGGFFGLVIGVPCLRLKGMYLALATFAAASICEKLVVVFHSVTYGREGLSGLDPISMNRMTTYYVSVILMIISASVLMIMVKSKIGLVLKSICDDESASEAVGINTRRYKLIAFVSASFMGGFWGAFLSHYMMHIGPEIFGFHVAITIFMVTIVGGVGTIIGPVGGAYLLILGSELLRDIGDIRLLIFSAATIIVYLLMPRGIVHPIIGLYTSVFGKVVGNSRIKL